MVKYLVFVDLERNVGKKHQKYYFPEAIQIGAIKITASDFQEVSRFDQYVKPSKNPCLDQYCIALTDITQEDINNAKSFNVVYKEFEEWVGDQNEVSFIFWGKEDIKCLSKEIANNNYKGSLLINKYFNFQSYLQSKTKKQLGLKTASEMFELEFEGRNHNALCDAINLKNLYVKILSSADVNKLWFEGKMNYIIGQLIENASYISQCKDFAIDIRKFMALSNKCSALLALSSSFNTEGREEKLAQIRKEMDELEKYVEDSIMKTFREETMCLQWVIVKGVLGKNFKTPEEMLKYWVTISQKYKYFTRNVRGTYGLRFTSIRDLYRQIGNKTYGFYQTQREIPIDINWFQ